MGDRDIFQLGPIETALLSPCQSSIRPSSNLLEGGRRPCFLVS